MSSIPYGTPEIHALSSGQLSARMAVAGRCVDSGDDAWFPMEPTTDHGRAAYEAVARDACLGCEVRGECLILALRTEAKRSVQAHGIWGGYAPWERDRMRRRVREAGAELLAVAS
jgi:hypothetical protein